MKKNKENSGNGATPQTSPEGEPIHPDVVRMAEMMLKQGQVMSPATQSIMTDLMGLLAEAEDRPINQRMDYLEGRGKPLPEVSEWLSTLLWEAVIDYCGEHNAPNALLNGIYWARELERMNGELQSGTAKGVKMIFVMDHLSEVFNIMMWLGGRLPFWEGVVTARPDLVVKWEVT